MAVNYAQQFRTRRSVTPQSEPIPGSNQVANNAGGFAWTSAWDQFKRFLVLGAEGGTFYVGEKDLIKQNHVATISCIKEDGLLAVKFIKDISLNGRRGGFCRAAQAVFRRTLPWERSRSNSGPLAYS